MKKKTFEVKPGYYEWNILCNGEIINSISDRFVEYVKKNPTLEDIYEVAMNWTDAVFEDFEDDEYDREDYWEIVKALTYAWSKHLSVDYGKDFESSYHKVAYAE